MARYGVLVLAWSLILAIALFSESTHAFNSNLGSVVSASLSTSRKTVVFSNLDEEAEPDAFELDAFADPLTSNKPPAPARTSEGTSYPIDVPSPILLASSMVLAIIGVGKQQ